MLGAIAGDIIGSRWEFTRIKTKAFPLFVEVSSYTDDSVLTCAVADVMLNDRDPVESLRAWANDTPILKGVGGYGQKFVLWAGHPEPQPPYGSLGNGGAMRVSPCAWLSVDLEQARANTVRVTEITHNHPEGIKGALATADAIWLARQGAAPESIRDHIAHIYGYDMRRSVDEIRPVHIRSERSPETVPESIICALEATSFEDAVRNAVSLGGDADTMAAIAGSIAEARFGVPSEIESAVRQRIPLSMLAILDQFQQAMA